MDTIIPYSGTLLARVDGWAELPEDVLRRCAMQAAGERDLDALWGLTEAWLVHEGRKGATISPHTLSSYRVGVNGLVTAWAGENLLHPSHRAASRWTRSLEARCKPSTVRSRLAAAKALYAALRWSRATTDDPWRDVHTKPDPTPANQKRLGYSMDEIEALLAHANPEKRCLILLGAHAGLRVSEILALTWSSVDLRGRTLTVHTGKGGGDRTVPLSLTLTSALRLLHDDTGPVIVGVRTRVGVWKRIKALCDIAGVPTRGIHALQHHAGTRVVRETGDLEDVAALLGHRSLDTARIYAKRAHHQGRNVVGSC